MFYQVRRFVQNDLSVYFFSYFYFIVINIYIGDMNWQLLELSFKVRGSK